MIATQVTLLATMHRKATPKARLPKHWELGHFEEIKLFKLLVMDNANICRAAASD